MNRVTPVLCLALLAACQSESELRFVSTLEADTSGVRFSDDGNESHVGMSGMTCTVSTEWGCPTEDADLPTEDEVVLDHFGGQTLAASAGAVHQIDDAGWNRSADMSIPQVRAARYTDEGVLMLRGDAEACHLQVGEVQTDLPTSFCADGLKPDVDRHRSTFYVASKDGIFALDRTGAQKISATGDLAAWDATLGQLYIATKGQTEVTALRRNGTEVWTTDVGLPITDLETRGDKGQVLVMATADDGLGRLFRLDGEKGRVLGDSQLPDSKGDIEVSDNGHSVGIIRPGSVHFFEMVILQEGEEVVPEEDPEDCLEGDRIGMD